MSGKTESQKPGGFLEILRRRQQETFVGRTQSITLFAENLQRPPEHPQRHFIFNVYGQGGVGKTTLLRYFRRLAAETGALTTYCDETVTDIPAMLARYASQLHEQGQPTPQFTARYQTFEIRRAELEADPQAPLASLLTAGAYQPPTRRPATAVSNSLLPLLAASFDAAELRELCYELGFSHEELGGSGHRDRARALIDYCRRRGSLVQLVDIARKKRPRVDWPYVAPAAQATAVTRRDPLQPHTAWDPFIRHKVSDPAEVRLLRDPARQLTPAFLADLQAVAARQTVVLMCDTYEQTALFADGWWRALLGGDYGSEVPSDIVVVLAGRRPLDENLWAPFSSIINYLPLEPFSEAEARAYLAQHGVQNDRVIEAILEISGRLPLLVATLAANRPQDVKDLAEPSDTAVSRFLQWIDDPARRQLAIDAALPQRVNPELLHVLDVDAGALHQWLQTMPFVIKRADGWLYYHDVVRSQLLRHKQQQNPGGWADLHARLADFHEQRRKDLDPEANDNEDAWQAEALATLYHRICGQPRTNMPQVIDGFARALGITRTYAHRWAETMAAAGRDKQEPALISWGARLAQALRAFEDDEYEVTIQIMDELLATWQLVAREEAIILSFRGQAYGLLDQHDTAVADLNQALELDPGNQIALSSRGLMHRILGWHENALADLSRALALDPDDDWALISRAITYQQMEQYEAALADLNRVVARNPDDDFALTTRGEILRILGQHEGAIADLTRAIALDPENDWTFANRGVAYQHIGDYEAALADLSRAIELNPEYSWALAQRGMAYLPLKQFEDALADLDRAIELDPDYQWALGSRGLTNRMMGQYKAAIVDLNRALELDSDDSWVLAQRGISFGQMEQYELALRDLNRALQLNPDYTWALVERGVTHGLMGQHEAAIADLNRAIAFDPDYTRALVQRGMTFRVMGQYDAAVTDLSRAIELEPEYERALYERADVYRLLGQYETAVADLSRVVALDPDNATALASRGENYRLLGQCETAVVDLSRAIAIDSEYQWALVERSIAYRLLGEYEAAIADLNRAVALDPEDEWALSVRGEAHLLQGDFRASLEDIERCLELEAEPDWTLFLRSLLYAHFGRQAESAADISEAITLAKTGYDLDPQDWRNTLNLALYQLSTGLADEAERLYREALPAPSASYREAIADLTLFLRLFPEQSQALQIRNLLQDELANRQE